MTDENVEISWSPEQMVEVTLRQPDDFLKVFSRFSDDFLRFPLRIGSPKDSLSISQQIP